MTISYKLKRTVLAMLNRNRATASNLGTFNESLMRRTLYMARLLSEVGDVSGSIIECGVGQGRGLAVWTSLSLLAQDRRQIWAFDSFEGFPRLAPEDKATTDFEASLSEYRQFDIPYVTTTLRQFGISDSDINRRIAFAKGFIPDSLELFDKKPIALLHLDLDIYEPYKAALDYFWDFVSPGGIVAFDEYDKAFDVHKWPGAQKAVNEFLDAHGLRGNLERDPGCGNVYLRKPLA